MGDLPNSLYSASLCTLFPIPVMSLRNSQCTLSNLYLLSQGSQVFLKHTWPHTCTPYDNTGRTNTSQKSCIKRRLIYALPPCICSALHASFCSGSLQSPCGLLHNTIMSF
jgi:hypothetical protein